MLSCKSVASSPSQAPTFAKHFHSLRSCGLLSVHLNPTAFDSIQRSRTRPKKCALELPKASTPSRDRQYTGYSPGKFFIFRTRFYNVASVILGMGNKDDVNVSDQDISRLHPVIFSTLFNVWTIYTAYRLHCIKGRVKCSPLRLTELPWEHGKQYLKQSPPFALWQGADEPLSMINHL